MQRFHLGQNTLPIEYVRQAFQRLAHLLSSDTFGRYRQCDLQLSVVIYMKNIFRSLLLFSTVCLAGAVQAGEDYSKSSKEVVQKPIPAESRFYMSLSAGGEFDIHATKFISNGGGDLGVAGVTSLPTKVQSRDFTATHAPGVINGNLEAGYKINSFATVFAGFTYSHGAGDSHNVGRVTDPFGAFGPAGGIYDLNAKVSDYEAYTGRAGIKLTLPRTLLDFIHAPKAITPYFSASVGGKYVEEAHARFTAGNFLNERVGLYKDSWVLTGLATFGYDYRITPAFSVVFESGYGYDTKPERSGDRLRFVSGVNDGGDRLYSSVSLGGKIKF